LTEKKKILVVAATIQEVKQLINELYFEKKEEGYYCSNNYEYLSIDLIITGIGGVASTYCLTRFINRNSYNLILNIGIAGSYKKDIPVGTVVNVIEENFADLGMEKGTEFHTLFEMGYKNRGEFPFSDGKIFNGGKNFKLVDGIPNVKGNTVNKINGTVETIDKMKNKFGADIETMEGAAIAYVAELEKIPWLQIRAISNYVAPREEFMWDAKLAIQNLTSMVTKILEKIDIEWN
jgi:futalosine hydrolase